MTVEEADAFLKKHRADLPPAAVDQADPRRPGRARTGSSGSTSSTAGSRRGCSARCSRNEGIGTLIYTNEYQAIRPAQKKDVRAVYHLIQQGVQADELVKRTRADMEKQIGDYFVFEVDRNPVACVALHHVPGAEQGRAGERVRGPAVREPGDRRRS